MSPTRPDGVDLVALCLVAFVLGLLGAVLAMGIP
jgi:hypothetical protein